MEALFLVGGNGIQVFIWDTEWKYDAVILF